MAILRSTHVNRSKPVWLTLSLALAVGLLGGCATGPDAHPRDPLEPLNRGVHRFNDAVDRVVLKPVATGYVQLTPSPVRAGVGHFFDNLGDLWSSVNATLQARPREAAENLMRFGVNTVFGLAGVLDVATEMGIPRTRLDFGHTLGRWGTPAGAYLVLPILGPSSVRDGAGLAFDLSADPASGLNDVAARNALTALRLADTRADLLGATSLLEEAALDRYSLTRDFYLNHRQRQIDDMVDRGMGLGADAQREP
jgi:phospholipid-binding lipoprotein MlaA